MPGWEQIGMQAAGQGISAGLGLLLQGQQDRRQLRQQEKLQNLQIAGNKQLTDYNFQKQMEMWKNTNYPAQMAMLKEAGLNPALMYKSGGDGGTTAISQGSVTGGNAPTGGNEIQAMMAMGLTRQLQQAQIENIKASTEKTKAETTAVAPGIQKIQAETASITQGIENQKVQAELIEAQRYATNILSDINARSSNSQVASAERRLQIETEQLESLMRENGIGNETIKAKIAQIKAESIGAMLHNLNTQAQTANIKQDTKLKWQQVEETIGKIKFLVAQTENMRDQITLGEEANRLREQLNDLSDPNLTPQIKEIVSGIIGGLIGQAVRPGEIKREKIGYK